MISFSHTSLTLLLFWLGQLQHSEYWGALLLGCPVPPSPQPDREQHQSHRWLELQGAREPRVPKSLPQQDWLLCLRFLLGPHQVAGAGPLLEPSHQISREALLQSSYARSSEFEWELAPWAHAGRFSGHLEVEGAPVSAVRAQNH